MESDNKACRKLNFQSEDVQEKSTQDINGETKNLTNSMSIVDSIHSKVRKGLIPTIGMTFQTEFDAFRFYNEYAYCFVFSIRKGRAHMLPNHVNVKDRVFVCSAEGWRGKDKRDVYVKSHRAETRFGCLAKMKIVYCQDSKKYSIVEFVPHHTHMVSSPSKTHFFRSHRKMTDA